MVNDMFLNMTTNWLQINHKKINKFIVDFIREKEETGRKALFVFVALQTMENIFCANDKIVITIKTLYYMEYFPC